MTGAAAAAAATAATTDISIGAKFWVKQNTAGKGKKEFARGRDSDRRTIIIQSGLGIKGDQRRDREIRQREQHRTQSKDTLGYNDFKSPTHTVPANFHRFDCRFHLQLREDIN